MITELAEYPEVWGQKNPEGLIFITDLFVDPSDIRIMGANKDTLKITHNGVAYMKFHASDMIERLSKCNEIKINLVGRANLNEWQGIVTP